ncbi:Ppx/GppA phosphatase family protein [Gracilimonas mengyeensis]|uniref:Ppx/GppA phosphatase n=1 Tax=Gracilimonas mengyeensis TaxID=1302730 RepID=A0A521EZC7_9BACT|nr:Ppx/GppA phosphatase family protein [Gracilimonas mengyeensis]SMO89294.1 Ppx/GppA phosphatase [Gracilimonas mengyeensis]
MDRDTAGSLNAAIDIGTNTVLLLVGKLEDVQLNPVHEEQRVPRLGKGVDADKNINPEATQRVIEALLEYKARLAADYPTVEKVTVTATSAVRDAANREEFMAEVKKQTGFDIRLLSGREEAEWTAAGALSMLEITSETETLILDIGGGSTEIAQLFEGDIKDAHSFDMGSVRYTERFLKDNPPTEAQIIDCQAEIARLFGSRPFEAAETIQAVGVAGTLTTLAALAQGITEYQPEKLNGFALSLEKVQQVIEWFKEEPYEELIPLNPRMLEKRADIFLAGMLILEGFMQHFKLQHIKVSTGGIRHGALLKSE